MKILSAIFLVSLVVFIGCNKDKPGHSESPRFNTMDMFVEKTKKFPYVISEERKTRILKNYAQLRIGMTKEEVLALLGEPDIEEKIYPKFGNPTTILGWCWDYFFYKFDSYHENLGKDQEIYIIYGINNKVKEVVASNISGLIGIK